MNHLPFVLIVSWFGYPRTILTPEWDLGVRIASHDMIFLGTSLRRIHALSCDSLVYLESPGLRRMIVSYPDEISWSNYIRTRVLESPTQFGGWIWRVQDSDVWLYPILMWRLSWIISDLVIWRVQHNLVGGIQDFVKLYPVDIESELIPSMFHWTEPLSWCDILVELHLNLCIGESNITWRVESSAS